jgi:hypothetical protein
MLPDLLSEVDAVGRRGAHVAVGTASIAFGNDFIKQTQALEGAELKRVLDAVGQFQTDPDHPSLNFHPVKDDPTGRLHTFRASKELRVLVARQGSIYVVLEAGHHDEVYERAGRMRFVSSPAIGFVGLVDIEPPPEDAMRVAPAKPDRGALDHWTDAELAEAGFDAGDIAAIRRCSAIDEIFDLDFADDPILQLIEMVEQTPEEWFTPALDPVAASEDRLRTAIAEAGGLAGISRLFTAEEVARLASAPIEEWMIFLHPDQRSVVEQRYSGPARVRGSAGTGKTVVALHRAAELANRFRAEEGPGNQILFTTFINSLPAVFEQLYNRLPNAVPGGVRFVNVDKLAGQICRDAGEKTWVDQRGVEAALATAWKDVVTPGSPVDRAGLTRGYMKDEVTAVIKGRGLNTIDEYLVLERTGRGTRFGEPLRRQAWALRETWDAEMDKRGTVDFVDIVRRARDLARQRVEPTFRAAIVDEAQDLNLIGLQLIRALVNGSEPDHDDGLLVVGDGAQRIYAGGFTLRQAGVEVRGRTTVLRTNYRNTAEIIGAAMAVAGQGSVDDLGDEYLRGEADADALRSGIRPVLIQCDDAEEEIAVVGERIASLVKTGAVGYGDVAVCVSTTKQTKRVEGALARLGVSVLDLSKYDGTPIDKVKVGTHHRAKGLEFKVVFLPYLGEEEFPRAQIAGQSDEEYAELVALSISQLFVAMTRARDGLFLLASGNPTAVVTAAQSYFEVV